MKEGKRAFLVLVAGMAAILLSGGCGMAYNNDIQEALGTEAGNVSASSYMASGYLGFCQWAKKVSPLVMAGSVAVGVLLLLAVKKDMAIRKKAIFVYIIGIPVFCLVFVYLVCFLYGVIF